MHLDDTIVAISTPPGRGGIGVVRLSGADSVRIAESMLRLAGGRKLEAGRAHFGELLDQATGERIDEVVATYFAKPHSYTTDDIVEISCHGAPVVLRHVVEAAMKSGARLAEPGEFTMRAFLNGRLDLTQAEAVRDLIDSQTLYQAKVAAQQLDGALSHRLQPVKQELVQLIATLEAGIDFADDDVSIMPSDQILLRIQAIREPLEKLAESFAFGRVVHQGLTLAIVGKPNVGKSSLFNRLIEREHAIVTATPGTTRDLVTETVAIDGIPVQLVDTAGIRNAVEEAESIGIRKSMEALADADLVLVVLDASAELDNIDRELLEQTKQRAAIIVHNKIDIAPGLVAENRESAGKMVSAEAQVPVVPTSTVTGDGIDELRKQILLRVQGEGGGQEAGFLTNVRQQDLVTKTLSSLEAAKAAVLSKTPHEMVLLDLYSGLRALDEITGATTADHILNLIFSTFCIGK